MFAIFSELIEEFEDKVEQTVFFTINEMCFLTRFPIFCSLVIGRKLISKNI